jgi:hypothetical protein
MKRTTLLLLIAAMPILSFGQYKKNYDEGQRNNNHDNRGRDNDDRGYGANCEAGSALTIFSENGERFLLIINGVKQNNYADSRVRIEGLPQVTNDIQIIFDDNRRPSISKRITFVDPVEGKAVNLAIKLERDRYGKPHLAFHRLSSLERDYRGEDGEYRMHYGEDRGHKPRQVVDVPPPPAGPTAMDAQTFASAKQAIKGSSFDDTKLSTAKSIANNNYFTTDQVIEICRLFNFSDSKLDFAKYAFKKTIDNNNYFKVNSVFSFDSEKEDLNNYVNSNR